MSSIKPEKIRASVWGIVATMLLALLIVIGSRNLNHFDAALVGYTFATLFATFGITYRYAMWLQRPPTKETARKLRERTEEVEHVAAKGVKLDPESPRAVASATAVRASQAVAASHRIAKVYLWRRWEIRDERLDRELRESRENLPRALEAIAASPSLPEDQLAQVQAAQTQWRFLADATAQLEKSPADARALEFACKAGDHIQESLQKLY
jgi:hypothetical protein